MDILVTSEEQMEKLGEKIAGVLQDRDLVYLIGDLGAGKTTLVRGIVRGLGYFGRVTSPTFTIMNIYDSVLPIYHFDFYRLQCQDLDDLGLEDYLGREGVCLIEWPEMGQNTLPREALIIKIDLIDDDYDLGRKISIASCGDNYQSKIEELEQRVNTGN